MNNFREDDEIIISQSRVDKFCKKHSFPPLKVKSVSIQANIRLSHVDYCSAYIEGQYHVFVIAIFEAPIFCKDDAGARSMETQHAGLLAKRLRELTGRGPKKTRAIYMNAGLIVYLINGLISNGDKIFASKGIDNAEHVERIAEHNLKEAFASMYMANNTAINIIDIDSDFSISLVFVGDKLTSTR